MKEIKYKVDYSPALFNFKSKKVEFGEEMSGEIMLN
jgi:hypothetical protein